MRYSEQTVTRITVCLLCDVCGSYGPVGDNKVEALRAAEEWGWRVDLPHDRAYCPEHVGVLLENRRKEKEMLTKRERFDEHAEILWDMCREGAPAAEFGDYLEAAFVERRTWEELRDPLVLACKFVDTVLKTIEEEQENEPR